MTQEGRNILLRVEIRCAEQWGIALWEMENERWGMPPSGATMAQFMNEAAEPFSAIPWHMAIRTVKSLRMNGRAA